MFLQLPICIGRLFFQIFHPELQNINLKILLIKLVINLHGLIPEDRQLLFEILYPIIRREHFLLFFRLVLDLREFLLDFLDVVSVSEQELGLVFLDNMLDFCIHVVDGGVDLVVQFEYLVGGFLVGG